MDTLLFHLSMNFVIPTCFPKHIIAATSTSSLDFKTGNPKFQQSEESLHSIFSNIDSIEWIDQVHGNISLSLPTQELTREADAVFTIKGNTLCAVRTADCVPILFSSSESPCVGAIHGGWRGLHAHIISNTLQALPVTPSSLKVWIGPAICHTCFEVGKKVRDLFVIQDSAYEPYFTPGEGCKYYGDLIAITKKQLMDSGVQEENIYGGEYCSKHQTLFHSHRRDGNTSGRIVSAIMIRE